ncbi:glutathione binding-like protein [uncultured Pseudoteredinibacter sp.]|uniref:glutathione S-transferase family protein n=1 Tax=uncultured Pseudoteredinibacter sp. TaxID=1641701 RepID=UPI00261CB875|nr:glutathione binding-like protein [uncultured Pseudoteredinibacter sp.]
MSDLQLWTAATPNGWKVSLMIEELRETGHALEGLRVRTIDLMAGEQFEEKFSRRNPNQKIPLFIDGDLNLMESCAIVQYLAEKYPSDLLPEEKKWQILPWVYWQAANVGPAFGNKLSYTRYMSDVPQEQKVHPLNRFNKEAQRLAGIIEEQLSQQNFICGESLSIADIVIYPWVRGWKWSKVDMSDKPNILAWLKRLRSRPAFERGLAYGAPEGEVDQWSEETKARYAKAGNKISQ